jgi:hypothetical protein
MGEPVLLNSGVVVHGQDWMWRRVRNRYGGHFSGYVLDALALLACAAAYALNKQFGAGIFLSGHFDDVMAGTILLAWAGFLAPEGSGSARFVRSYGGAFIIIGAASCVWEILVPLAVPRSTADIFDVIAYFAGAIAYVAIWKTQTKSRVERCGQ